MEMDVIVKTKTLKEALEQASKLIKGNKTIPVLNNAKIVAKENELTIKTQDEISRFSITIDAEVKKASEVLVDPKMMLSIVKSFDDEYIFITKEEGKPLNLQAGWTMTTLAVKNVEGYPDYKNEETKELIEMETKTLKEMITRTSICCTTDTTKPLFMGVYMKITNDNVIMAGTNTHFLGVAKTKNNKELNNEEKKELIIPKKFLEDIVSNNIIDTKIKIGIQRNMVVFKYDNACYMVRTIEGRFPDINRVIPKESPINVTVEREKLEKSISRNMLFDKDKKTTTMYFKINEKEIMMNSKDEAGSIYDKIKIQDAQGEDIKIAFNMEYLAKVLKWKEKYINIGMKNSLSPAVFKKDENEEKNTIEYTYVVTPLKTVETVKFEQDKKAAQEAKQTEETAKNEQAA